MLDSANNVEKIIQLIKTEPFLENDLSNVADIFVSKEECAEIEHCIKVYPI